MSYQSPALYYQELMRAHPWQVKVKNYLSKMRAGELPKRDKIWNGKATSWVTYRNRKDGKYTDNTTVFGFTTEAELCVFKQEYGL